MSKHLVTLRNIRQFGIVLFVAAVTFLVSFLISKWIHSPLTENGIKLYFADNITAGHQIIIDKFNRIHQDKIQVIPVNLPFSKFSTNERKELLARTLRSRSERLDIFAVDVIWNHRFAKWAEPLDDYFPDNFRDELIKFNKKLDSSFTKYTPDAKLENQLIYLYLNKC